MWNLVNLTPFAAERCFARDLDGVEYFVVAIKATFDLRADGSLQVAGTQQPIAYAPVYRGEATASSLVTDLDLVLGKPAADVLVRGHVHAPDSARELLVELRVGAHSKTLVAFGLRRWEKTWNGWRITPPEPFTRVPLVYEEAFGGPDDLRNPVGRGLVTTPLPGADTPLPALELADGRITSWLERPQPAGFGPLAPHWSPRRELAGTFDDTWRRERMPLPPLDADPRRLQSAPADQHHSLTGGEAIQLRNCTPSGLLRFTLPRVQFQVRSQFGAAWVDHCPEIRTVEVDADAGRLVVVWHSALECHTTLYALRSTEIAVLSADVALEPLRAS
jgi:hypothetical protein